MAIRFSILVACLLLFVAGVNNKALAGMTFSNVSVGGSLSIGSSFSMSSNDIIFEFPAATVGDAVDPLRSGDLVIQYDAESDDGVDQFSIVLSIAGALSGSGDIFFNEVVNDLNAAGSIASYNVVLDSNNVLPHMATLDFSRTSTRVHVAKTLTLDSAPNTVGFDLASISRITEMHFQVPEPSTLTLAALALLPLPFAGTKKKLAQRLGIHNCAVSNSTESRNQ
jgi:hypothetical protein